MKVNNIKQIIAKPIEQYRQCYKEHLQSDVPLIGDINSHIASHVGKELRPMLVLLAAGEGINENTIRMAAAMEMLHNASLMHDDVVDCSDTRRGQAAINNAWSNSIAVLCGDYYLARVMEIVSEVADKEATKIINRTVVTMAQGELQQLSGQKSDYYDVIYRKTASLMKACCELGRRDMKEFGRHFGMAFQLRDDWMDYYEEPSASKPPREELKKRMKEEIDNALQCLEDQPTTIYSQALKDLVGELNI